MATILFGGIRPFRSQSSLSKSCSWKSQHLYSTEHDPKIRLAQGTERGLACCVKCAYEGAQSRWGTAHFFAVAR